MAGIDAIPGGTDTIPAVPCEFQLFAKNKTAGRCDTKAIWPMTIGA